MRSNLRDPNILDADDDAKSGLDADELRAEQAGDLPERDAMSVIGLGGITGGLPPADVLDGVLNADLPIGTEPVDSLPGEPPPLVSGLPEGLPSGPPQGLPEVPSTLPSLDAVDERIDNLGVDNLVDGALNTMPNVVTAGTDASIEA
jgi:hypothetical protein